MRVNTSFEIVEIAGEYMAIPVGEEAKVTKGVVALNEAAAFILQVLKEPKEIDDLVDALVSAYQVDEITARDDVLAFVKKLTPLGIIKEQ